MKNIWMCIALALALAQVSDGNACVLAEEPNRSLTSYRDRGTRCEGVYSRQYAVEPGFRILAFFSGEPTADLNAEDSISIAVEGIDPETEKQIIVRISERNGRLRNYLMDSRNAQDIFRWKTDVLRALPGYLQARDLLGYACTPDCADEISDRTYYPVRISDNRSSESQLRMLYFVLSVPAGLESVDVKLERGGKSILLRRQSGPFTSTYRLNVLLNHSIKPGKYRLNLTGSSPDKGRRIYSAYVVVP